MEENHTCLQVHPTIARVLLLNVPPTYFEASIFFAESVYPPARQIALDMMSR